MKSYPPLPEANLLTPVLLWEGASHTQFRMVNRLGTVGSSWVWAEPSEASPPRSSQSLWSTWRVSLSVQLVHSIISELWAYMQCAVSIWSLKFCLLVVLNQLHKPGHCLIQCGRKSKSGNYFPKQALGYFWCSFSPGRRSFYPSQELTYSDQHVTVLLVRFHFSEVHSQVFKRQHAFHSAKYPHVFVWIPERQH